MARIVAAGSQELRGLHVFESCRHFIRTIPVLPRDPTDPDDLDTRAEDHLADEVRYRVMAPRAEMQRVKLGGL